MRQCRGEWQSLEVPEVRDGEYSPPQAVMPEVRLETSRSSEASASVDSRNAV